MLLFIQTGYSRDTNIIEELLPLINKRSSQVYNVSCTVMFMLNLVEPDWISIPCDEKLLCHVICYAGNDKNTLNRDHNINDKNVKDYSVCSADDTIIID